MPGPDFQIKAGDTASGIRSTLENSGGTAVNIQGATILFKMAAISGGTTVVAAAATNDQVGAGTVDGSTGVVHYNWGTSDVATAGWYLAEWEVTYTSGTVQSFPNDGFMIVAIKDDL